MAQSNVEISEFATFVSNSISTLEEIEQIIIGMDTTMSTSINELSGTMRDSIASNWVGIYNELKGEVNRLGGLLNAASSVQGANATYNNG